MDDARELRAMAFHEAGHAVAAFDLGIKFTQVSIIPDPETALLGHVATPCPSWIRPDREYTSRSSRFIERHIVVCLAGQYAERLALGRLNRQGAGNDLEMAYRWASHVCGDEDEMRAYVRYLAHKARLTVGSEWARYAIRALAAELLKRKRISGRRARALIQQTMREWLKGDPKVGTS